MKKIISICLFLIPFFVKAQDCKGYYFLQSNKTIEVTIYDKNGKEDGKVVHKVSNVTASGTTISAVLNSENFNRKGKSTSTSRGNIKCTDGVMMMDMKMNLTEQQQKPYANATGEVKNFYIEYPANMKVGDDLKDAQLTLNTKTNGMDQTTELKTTDRKVLAKETITSAAGTWECYKISFKSKVTTIIMGVSIPVSIEGTEWFCPGFGIVKTESKYGTTLVTSIQ